MTHSNVLAEDGPRWHLFITQNTIERKMLDKAAYNVKERGLPGIVHYHAANGECLDKCGVVKPGDIDE